MPGASSQAPPGLSARFRSWFASRSAAYLALTPQHPNAGELIGISLVVAGGIGNAIDRFTLGFVVDFIEPTFIDFPIFNIADIGVTCGIILFIVSLLIHERTEAKRAARGSENGGGE